MINNILLIIFMSFNKYSLVKCITQPEIRTKITNVITLSPGGFKGFYQLGVCKYIKENYDLTDYTFSGASAGSWNSLFLTFKRDFSEFKEKVLDDDVHKIKNIRELETVIKKKILTNFKTEDFHLEKLYVGVTTIQRIKPKLIIYNNFYDLEDALNACSASSHIPLITTNSFIKIYRNTFSFDGGFSKYPYLPNSVLNITPDIWNNKNNSSTIFDITDYTTIFSREKYSFNNLLDLGYYDSKQNKEYLDKIFI
jgi:hypothetical protein